MWSRLVSRVAVLDVGKGLAKGADVDDGQGQGASLVHGLVALACEGAVVSFLGTEITAADVAITVVDIYAARAFTTLRYAPTGPP